VSRASGSAAGSVVSATRVAKRHPARERLFGETTDKKPMRLVSTRTVDDLALLIYEPVRDA
jgi:hypothetical protein